MATAGKRPPAAGRAPRAAVKPRQSPAPRRKPVQPEAEAEGTLLEALHRAIAADRGARLKRAAQTLLDRAAEGEHWAIKELADRLDGRPNPAAGADRRRAVTVEVVRFAPGADADTPAE